MIVSVMGYVLVGTWLRGCVVHNGIISVLQLLRMVGMEGHGSVILEVIVAIIFVDAVTVFCGFCTKSHIDAIIQR